MLLWGCNLMNEKALAAMKVFIARENITKFNALLLTEKDGSKRRVLLELLHQERGKLASALNVDRDAVNTSSGDFVSFCDVAGRAIRPSAPDSGRRATPSTKPNSRPKKMPSVSETHSGQGLILPVPPFDPEQHSTGLSQQGPAVRRSHECRSPQTVRERPLRARSASTGIAGERGASRGARTAKVEGLRSSRIAAS